jgi:hypothetical protein
MKTKSSGTIISASKKKIEMGADMLVQRALPYF